MNRIACICLFLAGALALAAQVTQPAADTIGSVPASNKTIKIQEVQVKGRLADANIKSGSSGLNIDVKELKLLPKLVGETDPFKALQYLGGVSQSGEGNSGLYVRGGNNDQNLILLNGAIIQNPTHVFGMFSIFNPDLIGQMQFVKSGMPAEYGGRLSSVVDISTTNTVPAKIEVDGSIGLISSRISAQLPLSSKFSIYSALRGSYISSVILPSLSLVGMDSTFTQNKYEYWDANAGFIYNIAPRTKLSGHWYKGQDNFRLNELKESELEGNSTYWENSAAGLQLKHVFNDEWSLNQQFDYSRFKLQSGLEWKKSSIHLQSQFENFTCRTDFFHIKNHHQVKFGSELSYNVAIPNFVNTDSVLPLELNNQHNSINSAQLAIYARDEWSLNNWLLNIGVRANLYAHTGPYTDYNETGNTFYPNSRIIKTYWGLEPRFFSRYLIDAGSSVKLSATRHIQYMNQVPVLSMGVPTDLFIPASLYVGPQESWHFSGGYFRNLLQNNWEGSMEVYYKTLENQLEFKNGLQETFTNKMFEREVFTGRGWTYGAEWKISKNHGSFTGWLCYNLAWSYRQFAAINKGMPYLATNDRRHDLSVVGMYKLNDKWDFSAVFVYATGNRLNLPLSWFIIDNKLVFEYGKYNSFEMPAYHRLDISANCKLKPWHGIKSELNFSVYNVYNRSNPFQVFYSRTAPKDEKYNYQLKMSNLLPVIPSVSWTFHF
ncbi:MAG TPA: TonB-dependent receptor plug domain-containing protein [Paludibacter sp.]|nr:TonB-dependent receptor plug domain-containing protein [Paludibacter sp.]